MLTFKMSVDRDYCLIAVAHQLKMDEKITSARKFSAAVSKYMDMYGRICVDDHEAEDEDNFEAAEELVNKYYK